MSNAQNNNVAAAEVGFFDKVKAAVTSPLAKAIGISLVSAGAGAAGGYYFAKHKGAASAAPAGTDTLALPAPKASAK